MESKPDTPKTMAKALLLTELAKTNNCDYTLGHDGYWFLVQASDIGSSYSRNKYRHLQDRAACITKALQIAWPAEKCVVITEPLHLTVQGTDPIRPLEGSRGFAECPILSCGTECKFDDGIEDKHCHHYIGTDATLEPDPAQVRVYFLKTRRDGE